MVDEEDTYPRKQPVQARSRAMVEALLEATARVLADEGPQALNTNRIAELAGASIGSLYQYFPTREALVAALVERELERDLAGLDQLLERSAQAPLEALFETIVHGMIETTRSRRELHRVLLPMVERVHRDRLVQRARDQLTERMVALAEARRGELAARLQEEGGRLEAAVFVAIRAFELTFNAVKTERPELLESPELADDLLRLVRAVLL